MNKAAAPPRRPLVGGPRDGAAGLAPEPARRADAEAGAEHDWVATLNLVRQVSTQVRRTDESAKDLARNAQAFIRYANQMFEDEASFAETSRPSAAVVAGLCGAGASWLALVWFIVADDPLLGLGVSASAVARHHLVTLAQCTLFTCLTLVVAGVLHRGIQIARRFFEAVLKRTAPEAPPAGPAAAPPAAPQRLREGLLDGRAYALFDDGTVELETIFGVRTFASLDDARAFIGGPEPAPSAH